MKVFISSLISGFAPFRAACKSAITTLRHEPVMAEEFGALPHTPQIACLQGLRQSDLVVLLLGEHYGAVQAGSGLSATHEEYRDAKGRRPVIAFVQTGVTPEPEQAAFIKEVEGWEGGLMRSSFSSPDELRDGVVRGLHDYTVATVAGPVDTGALVSAALALLPKPDRNSARAPMLALSIASGPIQRILRPAEIEDQVLAEALHQTALFGETRIFDRKQGVETDIEKAALVVSQKNGNRIHLDEQGSVCLLLNMNEPDRERRDHGFPALIEETVFDRLLTGLGYISWLLERIDPTQRLTHLGIAARILASDHMAWRTQRERDASPGSGTMGWGNDDKPPVPLSKPRPALRLDRRSLAEDILVPLRRQWKQRG